MKTHTTAFKNKVKDFGREIDSIITCNIGGIDIELSNAMLNSVSPHYEGGILKSVMKQLDVDSNVEVPEGTIINYRFGVKVRNDIVVNYRDNYDYVDFGEYIVYKSEKQEDTNSWKLTCYDKMLYAMKDYVNLNITYPITIRNYINTLCNYLGLTFKNVSDTFANYDKQIQNELYITYNFDKEIWESLGYTFRDVFDELAQVTASTICINEEDGELEIRYINDTEDIIDEKYLKNINVNFGSKFGPVNSIVLSRSADSDTVYRQDEESVLQNGLCEIKITDNQIMNFNDRSSYLPDILNTLDGLEYYINDFSSTGITYYNVCDKYNIQIDNNTYNCIMLNNEINVTQGLEENIYTEIPGESVTDYSKSDKTDNKINQTYLIVNKQLGEIIGRVEDVEGSYSELKQTVDGLELNVGKRGDNILMGTELGGKLEDHWGEYEVLPYYSSALPPNLLQWNGYWYCTQTSANYEAGIIYEYEVRDDRWLPTTFTRKDLITESVEQEAIIIKSEDTMNTFVSQKALQLGYTATRGYYIDNTQKDLTFSCKINSTITDGHFTIYIIQCRGDKDGIEDEDYKTICEEVIEITEPMSFESLSYTFPIITDKDVVTGYLGTQEPSSGYWLDTTNYSVNHYYELKYRENNDEEWQNVKNKIFNDNGTYYRFRGYKYYATSLNKFDCQFIKIRFYNYDGQHVIRTDGILIGDIKLEYGSTATTWTNNYNEMYGENFKFDDKGFEISKGDYVLHLDEDEMTGKYRDTVAFQLNEFQTYSKQGVFEITDQDGLITKKMSDNTYFRYIR